MFYVEYRRIKSTWRHRPNVTLGKARHISKPFATINSPEETRMQLSGERKLINSPVRCSSLGWHFTPWWKEGGTMVQTHWHQRMSSAQSPSGTVAKSKPEPCLPPVTYRSVFGRLRKKKVTNYRRIYNLQDPLCKLSLSPLIKASQEMGLFFAKHWFTCGNSLENCFSVTSALMLGFLQAAISPTKPAHLQHIHCILLSFPRHQATEKHMWLQQR